jgi:hypothetical protein
MPAVRGNPADKWKRRAGVAQQDYSDGVSNPRRSWSQAAQGAASTWASGVQTAIAGGRFAKGVQKAGDSAWADGAKGKGVARFAEGVAGAMDKYQQGIAPYLAVITSTTLPVRGPKGSAANFQRSQVMGMALHNAKMKS